MKQVLHFAFVFIQSFKLLVATAYNCFWKGGDSFQKKKGLSGVSDLKSRLPYRSVQTL